MCIYWAGYDYTGYESESWYQEWYGSSGMTVQPFSSRTSCLENTDLALEWLAPRHFEEGRWNSIEKCEAGVCSSDPWDWSLTKDDKCGSIAGTCSRNCKKCESMTYEQEFCIVESIRLEAECINATNNLLWHATSKTCHGTTENHADCFKRVDATIMSCRNLGYRSCDALGWQADERYNGVFASLSSSSTPFGLQCYTNNYGICEDETSCESGGTCSDWTYENWDSYYFEYSDFTSDYSYDSDFLSATKCQSACAELSHCCNVDTEEGSNGWLSCLQACMVRVRGSDFSTCESNCVESTCSPTINGFTYTTCQECSDVPEHGGSNQYPDGQCSHRYGSSADACRDGCALGGGTLTHCLVMLVHEGQHVACQNIITR